MRIGGKKIEKVRVYGDTFLAKKAEAVKTVDDKTLKFAEVLTDTMIEFDGVGLAATQVGVGLRIIALGVPLPKDENGNLKISSPGEAILLNRMPLVLVNPEIISFGPDSSVRDEGCLSVPEIYAPVIRPSTLVFQAQILGAEATPDNVRLGPFPRLDIVRRTLPIPESCRDKIGQYNNCISSSFR